MPSPFPGIDPYLESQGYWPDLHASLTTYCRDALNEVLPESYEARLGEQLRLVERREPQARTVYPDVAILEGGPGRRTSAQTETAAGVLTLEPVTIDVPVEEIEEVRDLWIEIRHRPDRDLVTAIEILSPTNKLGEGYWQYQGKRRALIRQNVHLVELDLLVRGQRLLTEQELPAGTFFAFVSRADRRSKCDVYAWSIRHRLPNIKIPLRSPDPDVVLELPAVFALAYDRGRYARALDYAAPLDLPLAAVDRAWAEEHARASRP
jgi:Protein of unknown function (DUF4058)